MISSNNNLLNLMPTVANVMVITPLVLYRLRARDLLRKKGPTGNRIPANSQSYFTVLHVYGLMHVLSYELHM